MKTRLSSFNRHQRWKVGPGCLQTAKGFAGQMVPCILCGEDTGKLGTARQGAAEVLKWLLGVGLPWGGRHRGKSCDVLGSSGGCESLGAFGLPAHHALLISLPEGLGGLEALHTGAGGGGQE